MRLLRRRHRPTDVVLLRVHSGHLHLGVSTGRGYDTMCCRLIVSEETRVWTRAEMLAVWREKARYRCPDCSTVSRRPWPKVCAVTGW